MSIYIYIYNYIILQDQTCYHVLGHAVNKLTKHQDKVVAELACELVKKWKTYFKDKRDKPLIEVRCDSKTEEIRKAGRKHLMSSIGLSVSKFTYISQVDNLFKKSLANLNMTTYRTTIWSRAGDTIRLKS